MDSLHCTVTSKEVIAPKDSKVKHQRFQRKMQHAHHTPWTHLLRALHSVPRMPNLVGLLDRHPDELLPRPDNTIHPGCRWTIRA